MKKSSDPFVKVPLWFATEAAKATRTPKALVWLLLLHAVWKAKSSTVPLPNGRLTARGVSREVKRRALCELEAAGLIKVDRRHGKTVTVTLVVL